MPANVPPTIGANDDPVNKYNIISQYKNKKIMGNG